MDTAKKKTFVPYSSSVENYTYKQPYLLAAPDGQLKLAGGHALGLRERLDERRLQLVHNREVDGWV